MLPVVKLTHTGQQNSVYDAETGSGLVGGKLSHAESEKFHAEF